VIADDGSPNAHALAKVKASEDDRVVKWGALFGVMALTTNQPYFASVIATGTALWELCAYVRLLFATAPNQLPMRSP
jgi:hypothetical protein